jgi:SAM-dependent methyltransferase
VTNVEGREAPLWARQRRDRTRTPESPRAATRACDANHPGDSGNRARHDRARLGSGAGDVSFVAAEIVGPEGPVIGIDASPDAVVRATRRAEQGEMANVRFVESDIHVPAPGGPFDAVTGRLVLMYVPDPSAVLRIQATVLRPGGLVVPIELDVHTARTVPSIPLVGRLMLSIAEVFKRGGIPTSLGPRLWSVLQDAGLQPRGMIGIQPCFGPDDPGGPALIVGVVRTLLPLMERTGVAKAEEIDLATLQDRLSNEMTAALAVFVHPMLFSAWAKVEGPP